MRLIGGALLIFVLTASRVLAQVDKNESFAGNGGFTTSNGVFTTNTGTLTTRVPTSLDKGKRKHRHENDEHHEVPTIIVPTIVIPPDFSLLSWDGQTYYYNQGAFYQLVDQALTPVPAPIGIKVDKISTGYTEFTVGKEIYYLYRGVYYRKILGGYEVVKPPSGLNQEGLN